MFNDICVKKYILTVSIVSVARLYFSVSMDRSTLIVYIFHLFSDATNDAISPVARTILIVFFPTATRWPCVHLKLQKQRLFP
jgi:hypothetical protein